MNQINFHFLETAFQLQNELKYIAWINKICRHFEFSPGDINYIFCNDEFLLEINRKHLKHDYYTDIITFDYVSGQTLSGDLYISIDRVKENAETFNVSFKEELDRVMAHGLLHLIGYQDNTEAKRREIRAQEDFCLTLRA